MKVQVTQAQLPAGRQASTLQASAGAASKKQPAAPAAIDGEHSSGFIIIVIICAVLC